MRKEMFIARYGQEEYEKKLEHTRQWRVNNPDKMRESRRNWYLENPEKAWEHSRKQNEEHARKGGKYYLKRQLYDSTALRGERNVIRANHRRNWRKYKKLIAPGSQIHHAWREGTAEYEGVALVEKDAHQYGIIDVIVILEGKITLLFEGNYVDKK